MDTVSSPPRTGKELIDATRPYLAEDVSHAWWQVVTTLVPLGLALWVCIADGAWWLRLPAAILAGLITVRGFILYHDAMHGALLKNSPIARALFWVYGLLVLTPPQVWRDTHNYHHAHTAKIVGSHVGSYLMLTTDMYRKATPMQRLAYRAIRHPLNMLFGFFTIFLWGMCIGPFFRNPKRNWDCAVAVVLHAVLAVSLWRFAGAAAWFYGLQLPLMVACSMGAYLFYAQHNFPDIVVQPRETWSYTTAAVESSSYMVMGPVMNWFTGNIGYHHVHHLNPSIPFYRLREAMEGIPELQHPHTTSLHPRDILECFRLKLWDSAQKKMVGYPTDL